jgi:TolA-binding protein
VRSGYLAGFAALGLAAVLGCGQEGPFKRLENEVNDLKVEVFRQRQEIQNLAKKAEEEEKIRASEREKENRFRADTQEVLRQIRDNTQAMSNRLNYGATQQRPAVQPSRPQAMQGDNTAPPPVQELQPDDRQFAMAEKDFNAGNFSEAVDAADNLIRHFPDSDNIPEALYLKGRALYALKLYVRAQESFQKLCNDYPSSTRFRAARLSVGRCQLAQGNTLAAISTLEDIARRWPTSPEARSANELLQDIKK